MRPALLRAGLAASGLLLMAPGLRAQTARLQFEQGPYYAGEPLRVHLTAEGFDEEPVPAVEFQPPDGAQLRVVGVSPSVNQSISVVNGNVTRRREVKHIFELRLSAERPGQVILPPIRVVQGDKNAQSTATRLELHALPTREDTRVELLLPARPLYVGERASVTLSMRLPDELQRNLHSYTLRVPFFDSGKPFHFLDSDEDGDVSLDIALKDGKLSLPARVESERVGGQEYVRFSAERTLIPLEAGRQRIPPTTLLASEGTTFRRSLFGRRQATQLRKWSASDRVRELVVRPLPSQDRPASFAGSVGRGFTLEVSADRSVLRVGDPITLSLSLRGEGLESAALPPLSAEGLLPEGAFRVPEAELPGAIEGDEKRFTAQVRVLDASVSEIPALAFSWFDPVRERFETTYSRPIALSVDEAQRVGAEAVERAPQAPEESAPSPEAPLSPQWAESADLAIVGDVAALRAAASVDNRVALQATFYGAGLLLVTLALFDRRRRDVGPGVRTRLAALQQARRRLQKARSLPPEVLLEEVTDTLRRMRAELPDVAGPEIESFLADCDARRFAPTAGGGRADAGLLARAVELVAEFSERAR